MRQLAEYDTYDMNEQWLELFTGLNKVVITLWELRQEC